jgi:hypothetical protein
MQLGAVPPCVALGVGCVGLLDPVIQVPDEHTPLMQLLLLEHHAPTGSENCVEEVPDIGELSLVLLLPVVVTLVEARGWVVLVGEATADSELGLVEFIPDEVVDTLFFLGRLFVVLLFDEFELTPGVVVVSVFVVVTVLVPLFWLLGTLGFVPVRECGWIEGYRQDSQNPKQLRRRTL